MTHIIKTIIRNLLVLCIVVSARSLYTTPNIYVADYSNQQIAIIDAATNIVTYITIPSMLPSPPSWFVNPSCIAVAPNGTTACAGVNQNATIGSASEVFAVTIAIIDATFTLINQSTLISETTNQVSATSVAYTTDSNNVYVGCVANVIFPVTDLTGTPSVGAPISVTSGSPTDIAIANTSNGETAYIVTNIAAIYYMLTSNNTLVALNTTGIAATALSSVTITHDGKTAYALGTDGINGLIYIIDTASNTVTNLHAPITILGEFNPTGITTDGTYLYVTGIGNSKLYIIPISDSTMISIVDVSSIGLPYCLTPLRDAGTVYIGYSNGDVNSYPVPSGSPAGTTVPVGGGILNNSIATLPIPFTPSLLPPSSVSGCKTKNVFFLQTDYINNITWTAPTSGSPAAYAIYRDATLTQLVAIVPASGPLQYYDHGRNPNVTDSYYIVSVDANGNQSTANSVTVTQNC